MVRENGMVEHKKNMRKQEIEVLAPAGSFESLKAAVNAGADAVYMGGARFGARAYAESTGQDMLLPSLDYVHLHGRKLYLTVNTLLKETEMERELYDYLLPAYEAGVDALIIQDLGVWNFVRREFPKFRLHASTQMTITGVNGAQTAKRLGADRIVTARELSIAEIKKIHDAVNVEIETFVHGALCYCYSGQCLFSSMIGGRSGNRGRCAQPCRLPFALLENGKKKHLREGDYLLNLKDLCGLDSLGELLDAGVCSLKIEGRMKSPRYTAGVTSVYRRYVDQYQQAGSKGLKADLSDREFLLELFDRGGFSDGYFHTHNGKSMVALPEKPTFRQIDEARMTALDKAYVEKEIKEKIKGTLIFSKDFPVKLSLSCNGIPIEQTGPVVLAAKNRPMTEADLEKQMRKLGGTPFDLEELKVITDGTGFLPVGALNELRRAAVEKLTEALLSPYRRKQEETDQNENQSHREALAETQETGSSQRKDRQNREAQSPRIPRLSVLCDTEEQVLAALSFRSVSRIYVSLEQIGWDRFQALSEACHRAGKEYVPALPKICRSDTEKLLMENREKWLTPETDGLLVRVIDEIPLIHAPEISRADWYCIADHSLYTFNQEARTVYRDLGFSSDTAPIELNERELKARGLSGSELIVYGRLPMMVSAQCLKKTGGQCRKQPGLTMLTDRKNKHFPVKNFCRFCYNVIYNSEPLWLADQMESLLELGPELLRLQLTTETRSEACAVIGAYETALYGEQPEYQPSAWTRGHFRRGVE